MSALNRKGGSSAQKRRKSAIPEKKKAQPAPSKTAKDAPKRPSRKQAGAAFTPSRDQRNIVSLAAAVGYTQPAIARLITNPETGEPISEPTLAKHFAEELATGRERATLQVAGSLFGTATDRNNKGHVTAAIFWLKTQAKWQEPEPEWSRAKRVAAEVEAQVGEQTLTFTLKLEEDRPPEPGDEA